VSTAVVELSAGPIEYEDTGGNRPVVVMLPGLVMDGRLWRGVIDALPDEYRFVLPTLPFGGHRRPMRPDADLSLRGMGRIVAEFLERLELSDVTLCFNDWGGAQVMIADGQMARVERLALVACEAYENYPPGIAGRMAWASSWLPGGMTVMPVALSIRAVRSLPFTFGWMAKRGVPDELMRSWLEPLRDPGVRRDVRRYVRDCGAGRRAMRAATAALGSFTGPVLVVWASEDRLMPRAHGSRLAAAFPAGRLVEIPDSYTLVPIDQPELLAGHLHEFLAEGAAAVGSHVSRNAPAFGVAPAFGEAPATE
jgi:pimeloyl-ACP methyl ester carboxylesterase